MHKAFSPRIKISLVENTNLACFLTTVVFGGVVNNLLMQIFYMTPNILFCCRVTAISQPLSSRTLMNMLVMMGLRKLSLRSEGFELWRDEVVLELSYIVVFCVIDSRVVHLEDRATTTSPRLSCWARATVLIYWNWLCWTALCMFIWSNRVWEGIDLYFHMSGCDSCALRDRHRLDSWVLHKMCQTFHSKERIPFNVSLWQQEDF